MEASNIKPVLASRPISERISPLRSGRWNLPIDFCEIFGLFHTLQIPETAAKLVENSAAGIGTRRIGEFKIQNQSIPCTQDYLIGVSYFKV